MFGFINPFALIAILAAVVLFWRKKNLRNVQTTMVNLEIWKQLVNTVQTKKILSSPPFLLLQLAVYSLLVMALAQPYYSPVKNRISLTIVLDCSASMHTKVTGEDFSVFSKAIKATQNLLDELPQNAEITLWIFPQSIMYQGSPGFTQTVLRQCRPTYSEATIQHFLDALPQKKLLVTDGTEQIFADDNLQLLVVGNRHTNNVGIVDCSVVMVDDRVYQVFLAVENFSSQAVDCPFTIDFRGEHQIQSKLHIPGKKRVVWWQDIVSHKANELVISLDFPDNYPLDNKFHAVRLPRSKVWSNADKQIFLPVLRSIPGIDIIDDPSLANVCFIEQQPLPNASAECYKVFIGITEQGMTEEYQQAPKLVFTSDPLWQATYPELMQVQEAKVISSLEYSSLAATDQGIAIGYAEKKLYIGFSMEKSNWHHLPSFPIFWSNYFNKVAPNRDLFLATNKSNHIISTVESHNIAQLVAVSTPLEHIASYKTREQMLLTSSILILGMLLLLVLWYLENSK